MAILFMLGWWYSKGWGWAFAQIGVEIGKIGKIFAVRILLKTLFSPWKQISSTSTFQTFFQTLADNTVSRMVGFVIRFTMLLAALVWSFIILLCGIVFVILWPLVPFAIVILPIFYVLGVSF